MAEDGRWRLSPVYDVTFSGGPGGEHWTSYLGEGRYSGIPILMRLAEQSSLRAVEARGVIEQVQSALARFPSLAVELGIPLKLRTVVMQRLTQLAA